MSKYNTMDLKKYKMILDGISNKEEKDPSKIFKSIDFYEEKYQLLIKKYSPAYLQGCSWYVGPSFKDYLKMSSLNKLYNKQIEYTRLILLLSNN